MSVSVADPGRPDSIFTWRFQALSGDSWGGTLVADSVAHATNDVVAGIQGSYTILQESEFGWDLTTLGLEDGQVFVEWYFDAGSNLFLATFNGPALAAGTGGLGSERDRAWTGIGWSLFGAAGALQADVVQRQADARFTFVFEATSGDRWTGELLELASTFAPGDTLITAHGAYRILTEAALEPDIILNAGLVRLTGAYFDAFGGRDLEIQNGDSTAYQGTGGLGTELGFAWNGLAWVLFGQGGVLQANWALDDVLGGNNTLTGQEVADTLDGGPGDDRLDGRGGNDRLIGGTGADTLVGGSGLDVLIGGEGFDIADYGAEGGNQGISVNLLGFNPTDTVFARDSFGTFELLTGIEGVIGTDFADVMYGTNQGDFLSGRGDADQIVAWGGNDTLDGGSGADVMLAWTGNDSLTGGANNDWLWGGDGHDTGLGGDGMDVLVGDLPGSAETGNDSLVGGLGEDMLLGGAGHDTLLGSADTTAGSDAGNRDWLVGGAGNDLMFGGGGDDVIWEQLDTGEGGNDTAFGGDGHDLVLTGSGADSVDAGAGDDTVYGGQGADRIATGSGADLVWFTGLSDIGDVVTDFAPGADRAVVSSLLTGGMTPAQAFAQGVLALVASGPDTQLRYDADGAGGGAAVTVVTFLGLAPGSFTIGTDIF